MAIQLQLAYSWPMGMRGHKVCGMFNESSYVINNSKRILHKPNSRTCSEITLPQAIQRLCRSADLTVDRLVRRRAVSHSQNCTVLMNAPFPNPPFAAVLVVCVVYSSPLPPSPPQTSTTSGCAECGTRTALCEPGGGV